MRSPTHFFAHKTPYTDSIRFVIVESGSNNELNDMTRKTILLIDDHKDFREMLRMFIEKKLKDITVKEAATGEEGIQAAVEEKPDMALIDIHLSDISGLQAAREIKRRVPQCHLITMSMFKNHDQRQFVTQEAMAFIEKEEIGGKLIPLLYKCLNEGDRIKNGRTL